LAHSPRQFGVSCDQLGRSFAEKHIECATPAPVRFKERYIAEHFSRALFLGHNDLVVDPKTKRLCGAIEIRVVAYANRLLQDAPD
jgi:hypothetical protein